MRVTVRDLMTLNPVTVDATATIGEITQLVLDRALGEAYVCDAAGLLLGTVSDYALLKARLNRADSDQPVSQVMSRGLMILHPDSLLEDVAGVFRDSCHSRVAVVEQGRVIGQLSRRDVLRALIVLDDLRSDTDRHRRIEPGIVTAAKPHRPMHFSSDRQVDAPAFAFSESRNDSPT